MLWRCCLRSWRPKRDHPHFNLLLLLLDHLHLNLLQLGHLNLYHLLHPTILQDTESVLVAIAKLAMEDTSVAWELSGIPNVSVVMLAIFQFLIMRFPRMQSDSLSTELILSRSRRTALHTNMMEHPVVVAVKEWSDAIYLIHDDGRKLCLECLDSSIMDTHECQPLYLEIQEFYEGLMKVEQQVPLLLVKRQALNEAIKGEKYIQNCIHNHQTIGVCLSEEQTVNTILRRPNIGGYRITDICPKPYRLVRKFEVTAILVLYGQPRLLTGLILAHEMMYVWFCLKGYPNLSPKVERGICHVLAHMWLDSEINAGSGSNAASAPSSSFGSSKKLCEFLIQRIQTSWRSDPPPFYSSWL
ncbi:protein DA1-related 1-like isoform X2 [Salvia splendens]|uniref:protein DA1-related 1-like isoform X2 n=1 Tax=Salvia splendens TaxID=180675 RepID=UPI001C25201D|nr:protein DA1-related 1-like isoform X2 [Salvia splendens]